MERSSVRSFPTAVAPIAPVSTVEAAFIEFELNVIRGLVDHRAALRALARLALNELYALAVTDGEAFPLFSRYLEAAVRERLGPDAPPFELRGRAVMEELQEYLRGAAHRFLRSGGLPFATEQEVEAAAEEVAAELVVIAAKAFFRFYGLMRWIR